MKRAAVEATADLPYLVCTEILAHIHDLERPTEINIYINVCVYVFMYVYLCLYVYMCECMLFNTE